MLTRGLVDLQERLDGSNSQPNVVGTYILFFVHSRVHRITVENQAFLQYKTIVRVQYLPEFDLPVGFTNTLTYVDLYG